ncbi:MAG TPA: hypothetical protein VGN74_11400 [Brevundimonas sp.]|uniref:hypothetical protein n=1 Tax=Brevundimonas sp. TaxID=1871086 RepID=UPI002E11C200|nr:hypothetical protein [Brevundimonas sp.]
MPTTVPIGPTTSIDLSWLPEHERKALMADYAKGVLDIAKKAQDLHVDVGALKSTLGTLSDTTKDVAASGAAVTVTHTQQTSIGRTEVIMGNTEQAQKGRLTKSQTGERDYTLVYVIAGLIALVLVVMAVAGR